MHSYDQNRLEKAVNCYEVIFHPSQIQRGWGCQKMEAVKIGSIPRGKKIQTTERIEVMSEDEGSASFCWIPN